MGEPEDVAGLVGPPDTVIAGVLMHVMGDFTGRTLVVWEEPAARALCALLLRLGLSLGLRLTLPLRLRLLLSDGAGPMYWPGGGDLGAELRAVLAQL